jgi:hypothetical protein
MSFQSPFPSETGVLPAAKQHNKPSQPAYVPSHPITPDMAPLYSFVWAVPLVRHGVEVAAVTHSHYVRTLAYSAERRQGLQEGQKHVVGLALLLCRLTRAWLTAAAQDRPCSEPYPLVCLDSVVGHCAPSLSARAYEMLVAAWMC